MVQLGITCIKATVNNPVVRQGFTIGALTAIRQIKEVQSLNPVSLLKETAAMAEKVNDTLAKK